MRVEWSKLASVEEEVSVGIGLLYLLVLSISDSRMLVVCCSGTTMKYFVT